MFWSLIFLSLEFVCGLRLENSTCFDLPAIAVCLPAIAMCDGIPVARRARRWQAGAGIAVVRRPWRWHLPAIANKQRHLPAIATYARIEAVSCARRWQAGATHELSGEWQAGAGTGT